MSRETQKHYKQTTSCPLCGSKVFDRQFGSITSYYCANVRCDWALDWKTTKWDQDPPLARGVDGEEEEM